MRTKRPVSTFRLIVLFSLTLFALMLCQSARARELHDVVGIWLLDEGSGKVVKDSSGNSLDGEIIGAPEWVDGVFGKALEFDGVDDYVEIEYDPLLDIKHMTLMCWVFAPDSSNRVMIHRWAPPAYTLEIYQTKTTPVIPAGFNKPKTATPTGEWLHMAGTYDGENIIAYENGKAIDTLALGGDIPAGNSLLRFAARTDNASGRFNGMLDEIAIFSEALSEEEIQDIMNLGFEKYLAVEPAGKLATTWAEIKER